MTAAIEAETALGAENFKDIISCILNELIATNIKGGTGASTVISTQEYDDLKFFFENAYVNLKYDFAPKLV